MCIGLARSSRAAEVGADDHRLEVARAFGMAAVRAPVQVEKVVLVITVDEVVLGEVTAERA